MAEKSSSPTHIRSVQRFQTSKNQVDFDICWRQRVSREQSQLFNSYAGTKAYTISKVKEL